MAKKQNWIREHLFSSIFPALLFGALSGVVSALVVTLYKCCAKHAVSLSEIWIPFLRKNLFYLPLALLILWILSALFSRIYRKEADLGGGGIPASIGNLRGLFRFHWQKSLFGSFFLSLINFVIGVPLGTEGPSVQMGTSLGFGVVRLFPEKWRAWERYSATGGASAGFSVATGTPLSGILFSIEEAHQRISPLIVITAVISVLFAGITSHLISPLFGVENALFSVPVLPSLSLKELWLPLSVGLVFGMVSFLFLKFYTVLDRLFHQVLKKLSHQQKIFLLFSLTLLLGLFSLSFISTGHHLILSYFTEIPAVWMLLLIFLLRTTLTCSANLNSLTGGIFLPLLAIGATLAAILAKLCLSCGVSSERIPMILVLGICGCIGGMMKMPLTAVLFGVEALGLSQNLIPTLCCVSLAFVLPEAMGAESINDLALKRKEKTLPPRALVTQEITLTVEKNSFAVGKEVRDIFWPHGVFVLSAKHLNDACPLLEEGDRLSILMKTSRPEETRALLSAILESAPTDRKNKT